jgi:hypothetical protein
MLRERWELKEEDAQRDGTLLRGCRKRWELREDDDAQRDGSLEDAQRDGSLTERMHVP